MKYHSQKGQDKWVIEKVMQRKRGGFFLDLASADGVHLSNSIVLEKEYGWQGIAIEPNPSLYEKLTESRSCITENVVASDKYEKVKFRIDNGMGGGIVAKDTDNSFAVRKKELNSKECKIIECDTVLLIDILEKHNAPKEIDYWSLDIEGAEERVVGSFDFSKYTFGCITIERPTPLCNKILQKAGYVFVKNNNFDSFYVHPKYRGRVKTQPFSQVPKKNW